MTKYIILIGLLLVILFLGACGSGSKDRLAEETGTFKILEKEVNDGKAHYYSVKLDGKNIRFFVLTSNDGIVRAAFDACDVCYSAKKGYSQEGDYMVCNNCGQKFHESKINVVKGGCNPAPLNRKTSDGNVIIAADDFREGIKFF